MGKFDPSTERQVWQRVKAQPGPPPRDDLRMLLMLAQEAAGDFRFLMGQLKGPTAEQAKKLWEGAQESVACLRGLQQLRSMTPRQNQPLPGKGQSVRRTLEQSYHRARKLAGEYTARSAETECGMVFMGLARREQENCIRIAALLGQVGVK